MYCLEGSTMGKIRNQAIILTGIAFLAACALAVAGSLTGDQQLTSGGIDLLKILGGAIAGVVGAVSGSNDKSSV
jgi:hypothetical protein